MGHLICLPRDDKHIFFLQGYRALIFYCRNRGCRPHRPSSQHPALIHLQQILHRLTSSRISWGFVTVPRWELISWKPRSVCILKPKRSRYQSNWSRRKDSSHYVRDVGFLHDHSLWRGATWGARLWGDVTHIKRFKTVSVWQVAGCSITEPKAPNRQPHDERYNYLPNVYSYIRLFSGVCHCTMTTRRSPCSWLLTVKNCKSNKAQWKCASDSAYCMSVCVPAMWSEWAIDHSHRSKCFQKTDREAHTSDTHRCSVNISQVLKSLRAMQKERK